MTLRTLIQPRIDAGDTDEQILSWLNESVTVPRDVSWTDYMLWLRSVKGLRRLGVAMKNDLLSDDVRDAAEGALVVANTSQTLSLSRTDVRQALAPLVGPVFTTAERDALLALSDAEVSRWAANGFKAMDDASKLYWIAQARAL